MAGIGRDDQWDEAEEFSHGELAFDDSGESLPWLESDEEVAPESFDTMRLLGVGLIMLVVLALAVGAIWWFTNNGAGGGPEPDGSLIEAPDRPFKSPPEDAGGKTFAGTGDTSFAVGEGRRREGRLADAPAVQPDPVAPTTAPRESAPSAGTGVQVGAFPTREAAQAGWQALTRQTDALSGVDYRIVRGQADIGTVYRLQAAAGDAAAARRLCDALRADGLACLVK
ncbi:MAG: SPOR domain-containing protein [Qipengyuania sp.]